MRLATGKILSDPFDELVAVQPWHHQIEQHEVEAVVLSQFFQPNGAILGELNMESHFFQDGLQQNANGQIIINDKDFVAAAVDAIDHGGVVGCCEVHTGLMLEIIVNKLSHEPPDTQGEGRVFPFRPWVRRAGMSIVAVAGFASAAILVAAHYGWAGESFIWLYIGTLWLGGLKIVLDTRRPVAEIDRECLVIRPLHQFITRRIPWPDIRGSEQSGDRLIVHFDTPRGPRFVALNLNLVKGRREFLQLLDTMMQ